MKPISVYKVHNLHHNVKRRCKKCYCNLQRQILSYGKTQSRRAVKPISATFVSLVWCAGLAVAAEPPPVRIDMAPVALSDPEVSQVKRLISRRLKDPDTAKFIGIAAATAPPGRVKIVCGYVNARNGFGAYGGDLPFSLTLIADELGTTATAVEIAATPTGGKRVADYCRFQGVPLVRD